ncbi:hypothetical protein JCGZ_08606 [Jatropha curcas]|uniref:Aminotransferase-like plant mobile domain-containing protein n=1 Tax=Jatropha curcas TaxID=180498 RepID=A0A067KJQ6_JATCU|nr:hypothetical protein JCGZ_08606 [Jatropha curcas]
MSQLPEIPASAYTPEMETLGAILDIPTFEEEPVPISRNPLTFGTRPLQLLLLPGTEFPVRYETSQIHGFQTEPRFPPTMRYALMERWNDCTHTFVFGFSKMTLTPVDYAAITGLRFAGLVAPLDARYQTATLGAQLVRSLLGVTTQTRYTAQGCVSYEVIYRFWAERIRTRLAHGESCQWRLSLLLRPTPERRGIRPPSPSSSTPSHLSYYAPPRISEIRRCYYACET